MNNYLRNKLHFVIFASSIIVSDSMAGGYRIFIECLRHWLNQGHTAELITSKEGELMIRRYLNNPNLKIIVVGPENFNHNSRGASSLINSAIIYTLRTINGVYKSLSSPKYKYGAILYSTTPFWPDIFPAVISHFRNPGTVWMAAFSMFAPPVFGGWLSNHDSKAKIIESRALALKANEIPVYPVIKKWADIVYVNNEMDLERIRREGMPAENTIVIGGGVDVELSESIQVEGPIENEAVFVGRFHPQKGVLELVDIWSQVCETLPSARLVMIGNGPLIDAVAQKIKNCGMEKNIFLAGFVDGVEKIKIFYQSQIFLHPSLYDSGGMAAAEAMVCGLPGVSYDLPELRSYYPKGMLKARTSEEYVAHIIHLLTDPGFKNEMSTEAREWVKLWDWQKVSKKLLSQCQRISMKKIGKSL